MNDNFGRFDDNDGVDNGVDNVDMDREYGEVNFTMVENDKMSGLNGDNGLSSNQGNLIGSGDSYYGGDQQQARGTYFQSGVAADYSDVPPKGNGNGNGSGNRSGNRGRGSGFGIRATKFVAAAMAFGLLAGGVMSGVNYGVSRLSGNSGGSSSVNVPSTTISTSTNSSVTSDVSSVVANVMPSIVSITSTVNQTTYDIFNNAYDNESQGSGSGVIIGKNDDTLLIATNNHVVDSANKLQVTFVDNEIVSATVKGTDSDADLAVLAVKLSDIKESTLKEIKVAVLGNSDSLKVGEAAIAIGNALGYGQSVTVGYISAKDREVQLTDKVMTLLQTDAAINPGNSGGALLNINGEVIGINSAKYGGTDIEGMGYAIPISIASPIINDLMNQEVIPEAEQAYLGISGNDVTTEMAQRYGMPEGVYILQISANSPAEKVGLMAGDIIVGFDDKEIKTMESLQKALAKKRAGDEVKVKIKRQSSRGDYKEQTLNASLEAKGTASK